MVLNRNKQTNFLQLNLHSIFNFVITFFGSILMIVSSFIFRTDAAHLLRPRRMPLGSVDSEDGNGLGDDELNTLLPGTREVSADDLSQVRTKKKTQ